ncbi:MAG: caspase family protein [Lewinellaceae bacterium]|nr:caspase family protein [Lewinellaceae bacterium]
MKNILLCLLLPFLASAQTEKGATPLPTPPLSGGGRGEVRAVVVGISDYQDVGIPDLRFADRDATAFADWLKSPAGGSVPTDNIVLLTNNKATNARFSASLDWLVEASGEGDQCIIYFSGHGDVETKTRGQFGFLLAWDTPPTNYKAGAYSIIYLQDIVSTLSMDKKARVTVVADACHAGKLAGSSIGGTQATAQALAQQFANEVKIMSCQPNEFSLEGRQWGDGRGVFSYHLLDGLSGLADQNADGSIALREMDRYLEDKVPAETAPHQQTPLTVGDRNVLLARVDSAALADIRNRKKDVPQVFSGTDSKGLVEVFLANTDSATQALYHRFENALAAGNLLDGDSCADIFYKQLLQNEALKPMHGLMRRNFAVALQDEVQQALNALLADNPYEINHFLYNPEKYNEYPRYLRRTIELLGEKHYMYPALRSKELYFESYNLTQSLNAENVTLAFQDSIRPIAQQKLREAMALDSVSGYLYYAYASTFYNDGDYATFDTTLIWLKLAVNHSPQWILPYLELAYQYGGLYSETNDSEFWMNSALKIKPNSYVVQERLSWLYQWTNRTDESLALSEKMIRERPEIYNAYSTVGVTCLMRKEYERSEQYFEQSRAIDPSLNNMASMYSIVLLAKTRRQQQAVALADSILKNPSTTADMRLSSLYYLVGALEQNEQFDLADKIAVKLSVGDIAPVYIMQSLLAKGLFQIESGNLAAGRALLQKGFSLVPADFNTEIRRNRYEAILAEKEGNPTQADSLFQAALQIEIPSTGWLLARESGLLECLQKDFGLFLLRQKRAAEALAQFQKILEEEPNSWRGPYCMAIYYAGKGQDKQALDWLEKSLEHWLPTSKLMTDEPVFLKIRETKRFGQLLAKYFPEGAK